MWAPGTSERQPALVAAPDLAVDQAGAHLEVVHGLGHQRIALRPVIAALGDEPDAHGIAAGHETVAVVLDLVNPVGAGRRLVGGGWQAWLDEARPVGGKPFTHTLDQHAANLGSRSLESNRKGPGTGWNRSLPRPGAKGGRHSLAGRIRTSAARTEGSRGLRPELSTDRAARRPPRRLVGPMGSRGAEERGHHTACAAMRWGERANYK